MPVAAQTDFLPPVQPVFETIGLAKVSTSAADARRLGFLRPVDGMSMNRERVVADAKAVALERVREGYRKPLPRTIPVGGDSVLAALKLGVHLAWRPAASPTTTQWSAGPWRQCWREGRCRIKRW